MGNLQDKKPFPSFNVDKSGEENVSGRLSSKREGIGRLNLSKAITIQQE